MRRCKEQHTVEARISCGQQLMRKDLQTFGSSNFVPETPAPSGPRRDGNRVNGSCKSDMMYQLDNK